MAKPKRPTDRQIIEELAGIIRALAGDLTMYCGLPTHVRDAIQFRVQELTREPTDGND